MTRIIWTFARPIIFSAALLAASAEFVDAAPARLAIGTNLRQGPGVNFGVIATAPAGSVVDVIRCGPQWCNVTWGGRPGYMIARNLGIGGAPIGVVQSAPGPVVVVGPGGPDYYGYGPYYYGPRYYGYRGYGYRGYGYRGYGRRW